MIARFAVDRPLLSFIFSPLRPREKASPPRGRVLPLPGDGVALEGQSRSTTKSQNKGRTGFPVQGGEGCYGGCGSCGFSNVHGGREKTHSRAERVCAGGAGSRRRYFRLHHRKGCLSRVADTSAHSRARTSCLISSLLGGLQRP